MGIRQGNPVWEKNFWQEFLKFSYLYSSSMLTPILFVQLISKNTFNNTDTLCYSLSKKKGVVELSHKIM